MNKLINSILVLVLLFVFIVKDTCGYASESMPMPIPNQMLALSSNIEIPTIRGLRFNPDNPFEFEFIIDSPNETHLAKKEINRLLDYFLSALTVPEEKFWVNLSPYEEDRIMDDVLARTALGRDILAQDYYLKQLASSLTVPGTDLGNEYWNSPVEQQKIWIESDRTEVFEHANTVIITASRLKVTSESRLPKKMLDKIALDVNTGDNFKRLRQINNSFVLASWFKDTFIETFYQDYIDKEKLNGLEYVSPEHKNEVFLNYVQSYKKGVYNITKKIKTSSARTIKRNYCVGGVVLRKNYRHVDTFTSLTKPVIVVSSSIKAIEEEEHSLAWEELVNEFNKLFDELRNYSGQDDANLLNKHIESFESKLNEIADVYRQMTALDLGDENKRYKMQKFVLENAFLSHIMFLPQKNSSANIQRRIMAMSELEKLLIDRDIMVKRSVFELVLLDALMLHNANNKAARLFMHELEAHFNDQQYVAFIYNELIRANTLQFHHITDKVQVTELILKLIQRVVRDYPDTREEFRRQFDFKHPSLIMHLSVQQYSELAILVSSSLTKHTNGGVKLSNVLIRSKRTVISEAFKKNRALRLKGLKAVALSQKLLSPQDSYLLFE